MSLVSGCWWLIATPVGYCCPRVSSCGPGKRQGEFYHTPVVIVIIENDKKKKRKKSTLKKNK